MWLSDLLRPLRNWRHWTTANIVTGLTLSIPLLLIAGPVYAEIALIISIGYFLFECMQTRNWTWLQTRWVQIGFLLWAWLFVSGIFALSDQALAFKRAITWGRYLLLAVAIVFFYSRHAWWSRAVGWFLAGLLICVGIDTLVQYVFGMSLSGHVKPDYPGRLTGPFSRLIVGIFMAKLFWPSLAPVIGWAQKQTAFFKRIVLLLGYIGFIALVILLSGERMAFLLTGFALAVFALCAKGFRAPLLACGLSLVIALVAVIGTQPALRARAVEASHMLIHFNDSGYGVIFNNAITAWHQSPWTGVGPKNFVALCHEKGQALGYRDAIPETPDTFDCARHPHNPYLEWLADTGIIGLSLFIALVLTWLRKAIRTTWQQRFAPASVYLPQLALAVGLVPFLWPLQGNMSIFINWNGILCWWTIGVILGGLILQPSQANSV